MSLEQTENQKKRTFDFPGFSNFKETPKDHFEKKFCKATEKSQKWMKVRILKEL